MEKIFLPEAKHCCHEDTGCMGQEAARIAVMHSCLVTAILSDTLLKKARTGCC